MSYSFVINVKDGKPEVDPKAPNVSVPDGKFQVSGHVPDGSDKDWPHESLVLRRLDSKGVVQAEASASVRK